MSARGATTKGLPIVVTTARILDLVASGQPAAPGVPLLLRGEPGAGKDTLARLIHAASRRQSRSFIKLNCAADPADRLEVDLFGHEKGTSPQAIRRRLGSFEVANGGTLYLDEIGELPQALVPKLLHVFRTGEVSRAGGREVIRVDVRVVASTARSAETGGGDDLWQELRRLNAIEISIPPLRHRAEEIPVFASFFLEQFNRRYRRDVEICPEVMAAFRARSWPGNIRELEEAVQQLVLGGPMSPVH
jgi:transcriptional regulator with GAF, ATPase, and Fis domain